MNFIKQHFSWSEVESIAQSLISDVGFETALLAFFNQLASGDWRGTALHAALYALTRSVFKFCWNGIKEWIKAKDAVITPPHRNFGE